MLLPPRSKLRVSKEQYKRLLALKRAHHKREEEEHLATLKSIIDSTKEVGKEEDPSMLESHVGLQ